MLDPDVFAGVRIGPARDVARREDIRRAGLQSGVDCHAAVDREARSFRERDARAHADTDDHEIGIEHAAALQLHLLCGDALRGVFQMEDHAMLLVQLADEVAHLRPEHAFERTLLGRDHMHLELARAQRGRDFEADEARADHHRAFGAVGGLDDRAAVGERAQRVHMRQVRARNGEPHRLGAGRKQQAVVGDAACRP